MKCVCRFPTPTLSMMHTVTSGPGVQTAFKLTDRYQLVSSYGLFRRMTGVGGRPEVVIEGSMDRNTWTVSLLVFEQVRSVRIT